MKVKCHVAELSFLCIHAKLKSSVTRVMKQMQKQIQKVALRFYEWSIFQTWICMEIRYDKFQNIISLNLIQDNSWSKIEGYYIIFKIMHKVLIYDEV